MFTGIVKGKGQLLAIVDKQDLRSVTVLLPEGAEVGVELGASISVDGVCLTVTSLDGRSVRFDMMGETLARTTLGEYREGDEVNIERAAREGVEIGGHPLSGHIDCVCSVEQIEYPENNVVMTFKVPPPLIRYVFSKGYIGLNGTSLTVSNVDKKAGTSRCGLSPRRCD